MNEPLVSRPTATIDAVVLSVIAPCLNEEENVDLLATRTLATFDTLGISAELILVDDGSTDTTWERIAAFGMRDERVRGVRHTDNRGMEAAWRSGLDASAGELVCLIDADLQNRPEDIAKLYKAYLRELPDIVQAVRHPVAGVRRCHLFSRGLNHLLNLTFRMQLKDNKSGFVVCRRDVLARLLTHRYDYRYFQCFLGAAAGVHGYTSAEVDTEFDGRHAGESFLARFPIAVSVRTFWELLKYRWETSRATGPRPVARPSRWPMPSALADAAGSKL